jgi:hypothetical protein
VNPRYAAKIEEWTQRWHNGDPSWAHERLGWFDPDDYGIDLIPRKTAVDFITTHHYSRSVPAMRKYRFGLFHLADDAEALCGALVLTIPPRKEVLTGVFPRLVAYYESAEIGRLVLLDHVPHGAEGWFVAEVRRWLAGNTTIRGLVMHSDPEPRENNAGKIILPGHAGSVYQALSAPCLGTTKPRRITLVDGLVFSDRARSKILNLDQGWRYATQQLVDAGADPFDVAHDDPREWLPVALRQANAKSRDHGGCWRYASAVGANARQRARVRIEGTRCAYPKLDLGQMRLF